MTKSGEEAKDEGIPIRDRLIRLPEVLARVQISRSAWLKGVKEGRYPRGAGHSLLYYSNSQLIWYPGKMIWTLPTMARRTSSSSGAARQMKTVIVAID